MQHVLPALQHDDCHTPQYASLIGRTQVIDPLEQGGTLQAGA